jgi:hypothetical protein
MHTTLRLLPLAADPSPFHIAPIPGRVADWDGGYAVEAPDAAMTSAIASNLNHLCLEGALGVHRPTITTRRDYGISSGQKTRGGHGIDSAVAANEVNWTLRGPLHDLPCRHHQSPPGLTAACGAPSSAAAGPPSASVAPAGADFGGLFLS